MLQLMLSRFEAGSKKKMSLALAQVICLIYCEQGAYACFSETTLGGCGKRKLVNMFQLVAII